MNSSLRGPLFLCALALFSARPAAAQAPKTLAQVPSFPGAERVEASNPECPQYEARKPIEDVVKFYAQRLQGRETPGARGSHGELYMQGLEFEGVIDKLRPGETTTVFFAVGFWQREVYELHLKEGLPHRPPYRPAQWVLNAKFQWAHREAKGDAMWFTLELEDASAKTLLLGPKGHVTLIAPCVLDWGVASEEEEKAAAEPDEMERPEEPPEEPAKTKELVKAPSEKELGMPIYPGTRFDWQLSTELSGDEATYYVYFSDDPVPKVVQFYEARTGKKAVPGDGGGFWVVLKGNIPWPELGAVIEPAAGKINAGSAKTVITIRKVQPPEPE